MKKIGIIVTVALLGVLLALQYMQSRKQQPAGTEPAPAVQEQQPEGVPLPEGSTNFTEPDVTETRMNVPTPPPSKANFTPPSSPAGLGAIKGIDADFARQPACSAGTSLNDMLAAHGKTWGYGAKTGMIFTKEENDLVYGQLARYFSCMAVAYNDVNVCNYLPGGVQSKKGEDPFDSPNYRCVDPASTVLFYAYAGGRYTAGGEAACKKYLSGDRLKGGKVPPEFCREVSKGFAYICARPEAAANKTGCREAFPADGRYCRSQECLDNVSLYTSLRDGNISGCPERFMAECGVFTTRSASLCSSLLEKAGESYCSIYDAHDRNPPPDVLKQREAEKKKEEQKRIDEINKQAKEMLHKGKKTE